MADGEITAGEGQFRVDSGGGITISNPDPTVSFRPVVAEPAHMEQTVLEDKDTHPAYMNIMFWATIAVAIIGGLALAGTIALAWNGKEVPEGLPGAVQWALAILGVLLVGDALLGKLAVKE